MRDMKNGAHRTSRKASLAFALAIGVGLAGASTARAIDLGDLTKKATGAATGAAKDKVEKDINAKLLAESRKNQCSFKSDSDELMPGCDAKLKKLANTLVDAKKRLAQADVKSYRFEVSGHTDSSGKPEYNKELSQKRAAVIVKELVARGVPAGEITAVGMGSDKPVVTPDDTPAKKAKNRRYELQVRL